jgi:hypothetical protein
VCFTNFLVLVLVILVGVSSHFDVRALHNEVTLLATPISWPLGSPLGLDHVFVFVFVLIEEATLLNHFVELPYEECLSHPIFKTNQVLPICMPGSSFIHIVTSLVNNRNNIT